MNVCVRFKRQIGILFHEIWQIVRILSVVERVGKSHHEGEIKDDHDGHQRGSFPLKQLLLLLHRRGQLAHEVDEDDDGGRQEEEVYCLQSRLLPGEEWSEQLLPPVVIVVIVRVEVQTAGRCAEHVEEARGDYFAISDEPTCVVILLRALHDL